MRYRQKDMMLKGEFHGWVGAQYATRKERRNNSRNNEETETKWKQHPVVDATGDGNVRGVCNFLGSVSLQQKFEATDRPVL